MGKIKVQMQNDITGDLEDFEFEDTKTVREVIGNYLISHNIEGALDSQAIGCELGNTHEKLTCYERIDEPINQFVKNGDYLVVRSFTRKFEAEACTMTDPTKGKCQRGFSKTAPEWRVIHKGLNVFAKCLCPSCVAYQKIVIVSKGNQSVDFGTGHFQFPCPMCKAAAQPKTVAFYLCKYKMYGKKIGDTGMLENFGPIEGDANDKKYHTYYDPETNRDSTFIQYVVEIPKIY